MVKKLFALASVTALTGLVSAVGVAGCTTETVVEDSPTDAGSPDARQRAETAPPDDDDDDIPQCWKDDAIDMSSLPFKPPRVEKGACTEEESVKVIQNLFEEASKKGEDSITYVSIYEALAKANQDCASCVFAPDGETWAPIVTKVGGTPTEVIGVNDSGGGCMAIVSGEDDCGKGWAQYSGCVDEACKDCTEGEAQDCVRGVQQSACEAPTSSMVAACGANLSAYIQACFPTGVHPLYSAIRYQCIHGGDLQPGDAGTDASTESDADADIDD